MPKRGHDEDGDTDPPDVIKGRRKAKLNPKFKKTGPSIEESSYVRPAFAGFTAAAPAPSKGFTFGAKTPGAPIGGTSGVPAGFTFGASVAVSKPAEPSGASGGTSDVPAFSFGTSAAVSKPAEPSGASGSRPGVPAFSFGAPAAVSKPAEPSGARSGTSAVPSFSFGAPAAVSKPAEPSGATGSTSGVPAFSFGAPAAVSKPAKPSGASSTSRGFGGFSSIDASARSMSNATPAPPGISPQGAFDGLTSASATNAQPGSRGDTGATSTVVTSTRKRSESRDRVSGLTTRVAVRAAEPPFGKGLTAAKGAGLNKCLSIWLSHALETNPTAAMDPGLLDYIAHAAKLRYRVYLSKNRNPQVGTALKHTQGPPDDVVPAPAIPLLAVASTTAETAPPSATPAFSPSPVATPAPAPAPTPTPAPRPPVPAFSFTSPSTLPPATAPTSKFSITMPPLQPANSSKGSVLGAATGAGFTFNSAAIGGSGSGAAAIPRFKGFQLPSGTEIAPAAATAEADEDSMPKEDPSKLQRAEGEEQEQIVHEVRAKLYRFKSDERAWGDMGVGVLRLMRNESTDTRRLVLRNDMGKVLLNVALYAGMKLESVKNTVKFVANIAEAGPSSVMIKVKSDDASPLFEKIKEQLPPA